MRQKKVQYIDCLSDPSLYKQWIVQEYGEDIYYQRSVRRFMSGMSHVVQLAKMTGLPDGIAYMFVWEDIKKALGKESG